MVPVLLPFSVLSWKLLSCFSREFGIGKERAEAELSVLGSLEQNSRAAKERGL